LSLDGCHSIKFSPLLASGALEESERDMGALSCSLKSHARNLRGRVQTSLNDFLFCFFALLNFSLPSHALEINCCYHESFLDWVANKQLLH